MKYRYLALLPSAFMKSRSESGTGVQPLEGVALTFVRKQLLRLASGSRTCLKTRTRIQRSVFYS